MSNNKITKFFKLPFDQKILYSVTFCLMGITRFLILFFPFRIVSLLFGEKMKESSWDISQEMQEKATKIGLSIKKINPHTPWQSRCLVQAFTAQLLLRVYKISNTLYLGVDKDQIDGFQAHAWLRTGSIIITGGEVKDRFKMVAKFCRY